MIIHLNQFFKSYTYRGFEQIRATLTLIAKDGVIINKEQTTASAVRMPTNPVIPFQLCYFV